MNQPFGGHELLEVHEVLIKIKDGVILFKHYRPYVKDSELQRLLEHQLGFITSEYNMFVEKLRSNTTIVRTYGMYSLFSPTYGLKDKQVNPTETKGLEDKDIASSLLGNHKSSATIKTAAALECADYELRQLMVQSSNNSVNQAYDVWQYMNKKGYYQVPLFTTKTTEDYITSLDIKM